MRPGAPSVAFRLLPLLPRTLGHPLVSCRDLKHLAPGGGMGHFFGLEPRFLSEFQPVLRVAFSNGCQRRPHAPTLQRAYGRGVPAQAAICGEGQPWLWAVAPAFLAPSRGRRCLLV